ncbi:zinc finger matrin-type protein 1 [Sebastes umbrosus]|uniref:zinc finger matrin-type protein 1 n=1 Tax=Sebastes umbrosus TaxID=72105 RepID=UPI00189EF183|nr:zinc finger matrin-type protein 1 [Sebastes umbrosus]
MEARSVCTLLLAESDAHNNTSSTTNDADKVINTQTDSTQCEGGKSEEELLKGLLTDDYCHVCEAVLLFESQRLSHYEGKKHAQKIKVYLQTKRGEKTYEEPTGPQRPMTTDKDHFCELCNMVFSSHVVAKSHYEGKVHAKNLRKQGLQPPVIDRYTEVRDPDDADQKSAPEGVTEHHLNSAATTTPPSTEVDLKDPNKYCSMCVASFNNPQMALQHYNGRKHQRNQARQELLKELGDKVQQAESLMCQMCSVQFNSVEMYQAHMQGTKHQIKEKKVVDLCKSQQKDYNTFADELADYIQVQKARGITSKAGQVLPLGDTQKEGEEDEEEEEEAFNNVELNPRMPNLPPTANPPHHSRPGSYYPVEGWRPPYQGPPWPPNDWDYNCPPPVLPGSDSALFTGQPTKRRRRRKQSSSSSYTTSSYSSSSYSSSTSDNDDSEYRLREKRRIRRSRREREKRRRDEDPDKEEKRRKRRRMERVNDSEERRRGESGESEEERRRKKGKSHGKQRRRENKSREDFEVERGEIVMDNLMPEDVMDNRKGTEVHIQAEMNVEQGEGGQDEAAKPKYRKEKKKTKEKVDARTEEEKLWDDSILGC